VVAGFTAAHRTVRGKPSRWHGADIDSGAGHEFFGVPSPRLGPPLFEAPFGFDELPGLRTAIERRADPLGLSGRRLADFVLVADELACNSVRHGGGRGSIALWAHDGHAVVEVADSGLIADPLVGRRRPDFRSGGGAGLWTANQLCDLVLIHSTAESGTTVRAYLDTSPDTFDGAASGQ
jgi:anti-sigma regulatory factor (Ser/Thr protein kinase)